MFLDYRRISESKELGFSKRGLESAKVGNTAFREPSAMHLAGMNEFSLNFYPHPSHIILNKGGELA